MQGTLRDTPLPAVDLSALATTINHYGDAILKVFKSKLVAFWDEPVPESARNVPGSDTWLPDWDRHSSAVSSRCAALSNLQFAVMYGNCGYPNTQAFRPVNYRPRHWSERIR